MQTGRLEDKEASRQAGRYTADKKSTKSDVRHTHRDRQADNSLHNQRHKKIEKCFQLVEYKTIHSSLPSKNSKTLKRLSFGFHKLGPTSWMLFLRGKTP
jgi:hypothetical protein